MRWYYPAGVVFALLLGLGLGRMFAPRYQPPADCGEQRLRARAVELYQAGRLFDALKMKQMCTPARQLAEAESFRKDAEHKRQLWDSFETETKREQELSAEKITPECIDVELYTGEGWGWAITSGKAMLVVEGLEVEQSLDPVVWVLSDGDWWVYDRTADELNAYGNPPDPVLAVVASPSKGMRKMQVESGEMHGNVSTEEPIITEQSETNSGIDEKEAPDA